MTLEERAAARARCVAATAGPWVVDDAYDPDYGMEGPCYRGIDGWTDESPDGEYLLLSEADAAFVAAARTDLPTALDALDRLEAENASLREKLAVVRGLAADLHGELTKGGGAFVPPAAEVARTTGAWHQDEGTPHE